MLIENAKRLQLTVRYRNEVLASSNISASAELNAILDLTAKADGHLALAIREYGAGNYAGAMKHAILAVNLYGEALELQRELAEKHGIEFRAGTIALNLTTPHGSLALKLTPLERKLLLNLATPAGTQTLTLNETALALILQLQVLEARVSQLEKLLLSAEARPPAS